MDVDANDLMPRPPAAPAQRLLVVPQFLEHLSDLRVDCYRYGLDRFFEWPVDGQIELQDVAKALRAELCGTIAGDARPL